MQQAIFGYSCQLVANSCNALVRTVTTTFNIAIAFLNTTVHIDKVFTKTYTAYRIGPRCTICPHISSKTRVSIAKEFSHRVALIGINGQCSRCSINAFKLLYKVEIRHMIVTHTPNTGSRTLAHVPRPKPCAARLPAWTRMRPNHNALAVILFQENVTVIRYFISVLIVECELATLNNLIGCIKAYLVIMVSLRRSEAQ